MLSAVCGGIETAAPPLLEDSFELELEKQVKFAWGEGHSRQRKELVRRQRHEKAGRPEGGLARSPVARNLAQLRAEGWRLVELHSK